MSMEPKKTVLIVEDEMNIVDIVRFNLQREGYATLEAYDGEAGLALAREKKPDLILLDVMMPKMMGFDVCRALRAEGDNVPVIILTAREEEEDKILGLEIGADDYITKPFSMRELMARVKANIRRTAMVSGAAAESGMSAGGALTINTDSFQVFKNGKPIELTQREYGTTATSATMCARWTSPSAACARRSRTIPPRPATSSPAAAWATIIPRCDLPRPDRREALPCSARCT